MIFPPKRSPVKDHARAVQHLQQGARIAHASVMRLRTSNSAVIKNPSHLGVAVNLTGSTSIHRIYFSCSGADTEYAGRGRELWIYQE